MDEVTASGPYEVKIRNNHMYLMVTVSIVDNAIAPGSDWIDTCEISMSDELLKFVNGCIGKVDINNENISLILHDRQDYMRFVLEGWNETSKT